VSDTLLPCFTCGGRPVAGALAGSEGGTRVWIGCPVCQEKTQHFDAMEAAIAEWNARPRSSPSSPTGPPRPTVR
jgi:hypothetical protein